MKITAAACLLIVLLGGVENYPARGAETNDPPHVGSLREFDRFVFQGNNSFSARNLWLALNSTFDFPAQSHPSNPRDGFLKAIENHLRRGYIHCGFPEVSVAARYDESADRVVVKIQEGPRYLCGPIEVIGARTIPAQPLVEALSVINSRIDADVRPTSFQFLDNAPANQNESFETNSMEIWVPGQPAHFDALTLHHMSSKITNTLAQHGFFRSEFTARAVTDPTTRTAALEVRIIKEGPPAVLKRINLTGNRKNSRTTLLDYLDLKPGMPFSSELVANINNRLYHSARFLTNSVAFKGPDASGRVNLTISVVESDVKPSLADDPFDPADQVLLKARNWLAKWDEIDDEAVLTASDSSTGFAMELILAPKRGLLVQEFRTPGDTNGVRHTLILTPGQLALYVFDRQQKFAAPLSAVQFQSYVTVETHKPDADKNAMSLLAGVGFQTLGGSSNAPPFTLSLGLAPAAFPRLAPAKDFDRRFDGDQLIISNAYGIARLDTRTGRLIEWTTHNKPSEARIKFRFESNAWARARAEVEKDGSNFTNVYSANSPFSSGVAFFGNELLRFPQVAAFLKRSLPDKTCVALPGLLERLGQRDFLMPVAILRRMVVGSDDPGGRFEIPEMPHPPIDSGTFGAELSLVANGVIMGGDYLVPPRSWPWTVSRDFALLNRCQNYLEPDLESLSRPNDVGPIGCLVTAQISHNLGYPWASLAARRGLQRLSAGDFRNDYRIFLDERYFAGQLAVRLAATLGDLDDAQLDAVTALLSPGGGDFVRGCAQQIRSAPKNRPLIDTLAPLLDTFWEKELKRDVTDRLNKLAGD